MTHILFAYYGVPVGEFGPHLPAEHGSDDLRWPLKEYLEVEVGLERAREMGFEFLYTGVTTPFEAYFGVSLGTIGQTVRLARLEALEPTPEQVRQYREQLDALPEAFRTLLSAESTPAVRVVALPD